MMQVLLFTVISFLVCSILATLYKCVDRLIVSKICIHLDRLISKVYLSVESKMFKDLDNHE